MAVTIPAIISGVGVAVSAHSADKQRRQNTRNENAARTASEEASASADAAEEQARQAREADNFKSPDALRRKRFAQQRAQRSSTLLTGNSPSGGSSLLTGG